MTKSVYWRDIQDSKGNWEGMEVTVEAPSFRRPPLHLLTGHNGRMKLMLNDLPLFWATSEWGYDGAWVIRNGVTKDMNLALIPPIRSADVERYAPLTPVERIKAWSRYFVSRVSESSSTFMSPGSWLAQGMLPDAIKSRGDAEPGPAAWQFSSGKNDYFQYPESSLSGDEIVEGTQPQSIKWLDPGNLISLHEVDPLSARLKWWRKKAREGISPPILLWNISGLLSYLVVDGHYRLRAAMDENIQPTFVIISNMAAQEFCYSPEHQQHRVERLLIQRARNPGFTTDTFNKLLIDTFDDRPHLYASTYSWADIKSELEWVREVSQQLEVSGYLELLPKIIEYREWDVPRAAH